MRRVGPVLQSTLLVARWYVCWWEDPYQLEHIEEEIDLQFSRRTLEQTFLLSWVTYLMGCRLLRPSIFFMGSNDRIMRVATPIHTGGVGRFPLQSNTKTPVEVRTLGSISS